MTQLDIGLIGLAVMGENLALNIGRNGFGIGVYNRTTSKVDRFVEGRGSEFGVKGFHEVEKLCQSLARPRKIIVMVKAGRAVDAVIDSLTPYLEESDIIIDGGNSHFEDTERRVTALKEKGIEFIGAGISGGEEGALNGPSIMPGGAAAAWEAVAPILQKIAAKAGKKDEPCCDWVGGGGAGHFVKMVHNGIEYGDMQLLTEAYHLLSAGCGVSNDELGEIFSNFNKGPLNSFLTEITAEIFTVKEDGKAVLDVILDKAGQKGTGRWTVQSALDAGDAMTLVGEAVFARTLSSLKDERVQAEKIYGKQACGDLSRSEIVEDLESALYCAKIISYAQGFSLIKRVSEDKGWDIDLAAVARMWRAGCIIRSVFLDDVAAAFEKSASLPNLMLDSFFKNELVSRVSSWRNIVSTYALAGLPCPAQGSALSYFEGYRTGRLPANLIQAQRDYFGAHTYERVDRARGEFFHTNWTGEGGSTSSTSYDA